MTRLRFRFCAAASLAAVSLLMSFEAAAEVSAIDDLGRRLTLEAPARRIVALAPHVTELLFAAGAAGRVVGVSRYSDFPPAASGIAEVGDAGRADLERVVMLEPDLVVVWETGGSPGDVKRLEKLGIPVFVTEPRRLADIPRLLRVLGKLAGTADAAEEEARRFEQMLEELARRYGNGRPVTVFYQIWHQPLMTVNAEHMIADVIRLCGGHNVFESSPVLTPVLSAESLLVTDPEVIIASVSALSAQAEVRRFWSSLPSLRAVQRAHLEFIHPDLIQRQAPRILDGAKQVCEALEKARGR